MYGLDFHSESGTLLPPYHGPYAGLPVPIVRVPSCAERDVDADCAHSAAVAGAAPEVSDAAGVSSSGAQAAPIIAKHRQTDHDLPHRQNPLLQSCHVVSGW